MTINRCIILLFLCLLFCKNGSAQDENCNVNMSMALIKGGRSSAIALKLNKTDTLRVNVGCFEMCKILVQPASGKTQIKQIDRNHFLITPIRKGTHKVTILTDCPKGTKVKLGGNVLDSSGVTTIGTEEFQVE